MGPGSTRRWIGDQRFNELVNGRRGVTPSTALRLARFLNTSPGYWLNLQTRWDLYHGQRSQESALAAITPIETATGRITGQNGTLGQYI